MINEAIMKSKTFTIKSVNYIHFKDIDFMFLSFLQTRDVGTGICKPCCECSKLSDSRDAQAMPENKCCH